MGKHHKHHKNKDNDTNSPKSKYSTNESDAPKSKYSNNEPSRNKHHNKHQDKKPTYRHRRHKKHGKIGHGFNKVGRGIVKRGDSVGKFTGKMIQMQQEGIKGIMDGLSNPIVLIGICVVAGLFVINMPQK